MTYDQFLADLNRASLHRPHFARHEGHRAIRYGDLCPIEIVAELTLGRPSEGWMRDARALDLDLSIAYRIVAAADGVPSADRSVRADLLHAAACLHSRGLSALVAQKGD